MLKCEEVVELVAGEQAAQGNRLLRLRLSLHLLMCQHCRRYKAQIDAMGRATRELWRRPEEATIARLRQRILRGDSNEQP